MSTKTRFEEEAKGNSEMAYSIVENGHQHNSPQSQVQLEATNEFLF